MTDLGNASRWAGLLCLFVVSLFMMLATLLFGFRALLFWKEQGIDAALWPLAAMGAVAILAAIALIGTFWMSDKVR